MTAITNWGRPLQTVEYVLVLILTLALYGDAFPYGLPLVLPVTFAGFIWFAVIKRRLSVPINAGFSLLVLCFSLYLVAVIRTSYLYETNSRDLRSAATVLLFGPLLFSIRSLPEFQSFRDKAEVAGAVAGTGLAIIGLYKFHLMATGARLEMIWMEGYQYPWGTSLIVDYNFYAFAMLCGAISCLFCVSHFSSPAGKIACMLGFCLNALSLSLAGSRRGWVTEALLLLAVLVLILRWLGVSLSSFGSSRLIPTQRLKMIAALIIVATTGSVLVNKSQPALHSNQASFQNDLKDLEFRFGTLRDAGESFGARTSRWEFAAQMLNQASPFKLMFGQGFDYLRIFANSFVPYQKDTNGTGAEDYPHNPLISAAIYSGITGSIIVLIFVVLALVRYLQNHKIDTYFLALYFASLWFILPAYDSIFSGKLFGFLLLIPWSIPQTKRSILARANSRSSYPIAYLPIR